MQEKFEDPKLVDLEGKEITPEQLEEEELEEVSGGLGRDNDVPGDLCLGGG